MQYFNFSQALLMPWWNVSASLCEEHALSSFANAIHLSNWRKDLNPLIVGYVHQVTCNCPGRGQDEKLVLGPAQASQEFFLKKIKIPEKGKRTWLLAWKAEIRRQFLDFVQHKTSTKLSYGVDNTLIKPTTTACKWEEKSLKSYRSRY
jgi:hypothetical protein